MVSGELSRGIYDTTGLNMDTLSSLLLGLNVFFTWYFWKCASVAFEDGKDAVGWVDIFFSAFNGAAVAATIL